VGAQEVAERRADSLKKLHTLIETRTRTLVLFSQLVGLRPFEPGEEIEALLQEFCETLVDYTASAHFQLYRFIEEGTERRQAVKIAAAEVYPRITELTQHILDFNDKYDGERQVENTDALDRDLSFLGEVLADRIAAEDRILEALTSSRR